MHPLPVASGDLPDPCRIVEFEGSGHIVCKIDRRYRMRLALNGENGKPYGSLAAFIAGQQASAGLVLAMNAGMYEPDLSPVGLYVEDGRMLGPLRKEDGYGNFFMKPNGVFFIGRDGAGIMTTEAFAKRDAGVRFATQSGPMLVINGKIHPRFEPNGTSRYIRNGVGIQGPHTVFLAISTEPVSLGRFARLFRDKLGCANALFFDGGISALSDDRNLLIGGTDPVGPILAVYKRN